MPELKSQPAYERLAEELKKRILGGEFDADRRLPSESALCAEYGVSRGTVRSALAALRTVGLISSRTGAGSYVMVDARPSAVLPLPLWGVQGTQVEAPAISIGHTTGAVAALLDRAEVPIFIAERRATLPATDGTNRPALHQMIIPFDTAHASAPELESELPEVSVQDVFRKLTAAGHDLQWHNEVAARMPVPDERTALDMADGHPMLVSYRITADRADAGRPLLLEILRTSGDAARLRFELDPTA